ncbi:MAG TPA: SDR family NAD(P)-dependent oxidoreductase, partial [Candidatus Nitrosotenuis sp.]|nr:SDR family NAD(P)-dependent oxidoreductase [Candidatus Nitrosotenuis sp.]
MDQSSPLTGQVALITGASRGIGLAIARRLGSMGARLGLCSRDARRLDEVARQLSAAGVQVVAASCDVARGEDVNRWVAQMHEQLGDADILVNNAGIGMFG